MPKHLVIVGAGITGITTGYLLAQQGYRITIVDPHRYAAMETSYANGGQLSASNAEVWNRWSTVFKALTWMLRSDAPLLLNPKPNWHKASWAAEFIWNIRNYESNTITTTQMAIAARNELFAIAACERIDFDHQRQGILHLYQNRRDYEQAAKVTALLARGGLERRSVPNDEIHQIEPALRGNFYGGFFTPSDSTGDIHKFTRGLAQVCLRYDVTFLHEWTVERIRSNSYGVHIDIKAASTVDGAGSHDAIQADGVVICAGVGSRSLAQELGDRLNIYPVKGYSITVNLTNDATRSAAPWVSLLDDEAKIVTSRLGPDRLRIAGTAELNDFNLDIRADRIRPLIAWSRRMFPEVDTDAVIPWAGLRPMLPDMVPAVRSGKQPRVFYNTGHGHLGWTLSGITARMTASLVAQQL